MKPYFLVRSFNHLSGSGPNLSQGLLGPGSFGDFGGRGAPVSGNLNLGLLAMRAFSFAQTTRFGRGRVQIRSCLDPTLAKLPILTNLLVRGRVSAVTDTAGAETVVWRRVVRCRGRRTWKG